MDGQGGGVGVGERSCAGPSSGSSVRKVAGGTVRKKGPAPFASLEDLSDESPPEDKTSRLTLPGIREDGGAKGSAPGPPGSRGPAPRIDISRASSSSHHEDSSPERELFAGSGEGGTAKIGLGFTEEMAQELRSSTEELDFQDPEDETKTRRKKLTQQHAITKYEVDSQVVQERKDSACSDSGLLMIGLGGRTSRLSSIGSAASGGSVASHGSAASHASHLSHMSHLSAASNYSRASRSSSPHRLLLETSFCGPKPIPTLSIEAENVATDDVEATLLARSTPDPTGAVLPPDGALTPPHPHQSTRNTLDVRISKSSSKPKSRDQKPRVKKPKPPPDPNALVRIIPLHGSVDDEEDVDSITTEHEEESTPQPGKMPSPPDGGIYIPLKGPDVDYRAITAQKPTKKTASEVQAPRVTPKKPPPVEESDLVRFISLHGEDDEELERARREKNAHWSKDSSQSVVQFKPWTDTPSRAASSRHRPKSTTPEPHGSESRRKDSARNKSSVFSFLKKTGKEKQSSPQKPRAEEKPAVDPRITNVEFSFKKEEYKPKKLPEGDVVIIPLHSPDSVIEPLPLYAPDTPEESRQIQYQIEKSLEQVGVPPSAMKQGVTSDSLSPGMETNVVVVDVIKEDVNILDEFYEPEIDSPPAMFPTSDEEEPPVVSPPRAVTPARSPRVTSPISPVTRGPPPRSVSPGVRKVVSPVTTTAARSPSPSTAGPPRAPKTPSPGSQPPPPPTRARASPPVAPPPRSRSREPLPQASPTEPRIITTSISKEKVSETTSEKTITKITEKTIKVGDETDSKTIEIVEKTVKVSEKVRCEVGPDDDQLAGPALANHMASRRPEPEPSETESEAESEAGPLPDFSAPLPEQESIEERKGLFHQAESTEEELPYVPTTLPLERSIAVPIIPVKQRVAEIRTCPIERPRSTTPINPAMLDEYAATVDDTSTSSSSSEKMQITLPRTDSVKVGRGAKGPVRAKPWTQFAEEGLHSPKEGRRSGKESPPPPPLPPRGTAPPWVSFDELPERKRAPRRITTLPSARPHAPPHLHPSGSGLIYSYVNPEECSCECHEAQPRAPGPAQPPAHPPPSASTEQCYRR